MRRNAAFSISPPLYQPGLARMFTTFACPNEINAYASTISPIWTALIFSRP